MEREYEWDEQKNKANFKKHGVWFEEAKTVFDDPLHIEGIDKSQNYEGEERYIALGCSRQERGLYVVFCERTTKADKEIIRIISSRRQTPKERRILESTEL